jgi:hypothetical protein
MNTENAAMSDPVQSVTRVTGPKCELGRRSIKIFKLEGQGWFDL